VIVFFLQEILNRKLSVIQLLGFKPVAGKEHRGKKDDVEDRAKRRRFLWGFFNLIFYFNKGILVILQPKMTSFWVFHPF
jgi:hypothetical protein